MHRHRIRAFVAGAGGGETDVPVTIFAGGQYVRYIAGTGLMTTSLGPGTTVVNAIATWGDTTGTQLALTPVLLDNAGNMTQLVTLDGQDAPRITATLATASPTTGKLTKWASNAAPWKLDATQTLNVVNEDGADSIYGVGSINGIIPSRWVLGPLGGGSTDNAIVRWDGTTGRLVQNSTVALTDAAQLTGVAEVNGVDVSALSTTNQRWLFGPKTTVINRLLVWNSTGGGLVGDAPIVFVPETNTLTGAVNVSVSTVNGVNPSNWVRGPASATSSSLAIYSDTTGKLIGSSVVTVNGSGSLSGVGLLNGDRWVKPRFGASTTNRVATWFGTGADTLQETTTTIDASGNVGGVATINGKDPSTWVSGPLSASNNAVARFNGTTGLLIKNAPVQIDDSGNVSGVTTVNSTDPSTWVVGPASSTSTRVATFNGTSGKLIQQSPVTIDSSGNMASLATLNGISPLEWLKGVLSFFGGSTGLVPGYGLPKRAASYRIGYVAFVPVTFGDTASTISLSMSSSDNNGSWGVHMPNSSAAGALGTGGTWANPGTLTNASFLFHATAVVPAGSGIHNLSLNISSSGSMTLLTGWQVWCYQ